MARLLRPRHRELHVGEEARARDARGCAVRSRRTARREPRRRRRARAPRRAFCRSAPLTRIVCRCVKAVRIHEDGGPDVLVLEEVPDPVAGAGRGAHPPARLGAEPSRRLDPQGPALRAEAADPRRRRRRRRRGARRGRRGLRAGRARRDQPRASRPPNGAIHVIGEHGDGTNARADRRAGDERLPDPRRPLVRGGRGLPARLRDGVPDARHARAPAGGEWVLLWGIGSGVSTAGLAIARALGARTIVTSSSDEKLARATRARRGRDREPRRRRREGRRQGGDRRSRRRHRRRPRRRGDVAHVARRRRARGADRRLRRDARARTRPRRCTASGGSS